MLNNTSTDSEKKLHHHTANMNKPALWMSESQGEETRKKVFHHQVGVRDGVFTSDGS